MTQIFKSHTLRTLLKIVCPFLVLLVMNGCNQCTPCIQTTKEIRPEFTPTATLVTPTLTPTITPSQPETIIFEPIENDPNHPYHINTFLNLWTKVEKEKISFYANNWLSDYTYDKTGALWIVGGFGVIKRDLEGKQTQYSIKNGLPKNFFTRIAISPEGEIWIGGTDNALFRFDGAQWIDEGERIPPPFDDRTHYLCYSKDITGIDFDPDGSVWVMNSGIEIYRQAYGQWINVPFPKELLPIAGGGACPIGMRVKSDQDITIKLSVC